MGGIPDSAAIEWNWIVRGRPRCVHESSVCELDDGRLTGELVCLGCGTVWWQRGDHPPPRGE